MPESESEEEVDMGGLFGDDDDYGGEISYYAPSKALKSVPKMSMAKELEEEDCDMGGLFGDDSDYGDESPQTIK